MKNILLVTFVFISSMYYCQPKKGNFLAGPAFNLTRSTYKPENFNNPNYSQTSSQTNFNSTLKLGYFVRNKIAVGILWQYSFSNSKAKEVDLNSLKENSSPGNMNYFGLFGRYYAMLNGGKLGFFGQSEAGYGFGKSTSTFESTNNGVYERSDKHSTNSGFTVAVRPGIVYFITKRLGLEGTFGSISFDYTTSKDLYQGEAYFKKTTSNLNLNLNSASFYFGLNFYFAREKA